ncbi:MAG: bZIP transcription factor [Oscillospiraceae bacterium]|nr:bZIP transcription factor [Oscillospiraceae bacterium]
MKKLSTVLILFLAAICLLVGCNSEETAALEAENEALKQELSALMEENANLRQQLAELSQQSGLADFSADYTAWSSSNGATITVTATPAAYTEGQHADLVVWLNGVEVEKMPFQWDGTTYSATVELEAADGYTFLCVLSTPDGKENEIVLDSPEMDALIYLESNLTAFLNMVVTDWTAEEGILSLNAGYAQVQLPRLADVSIASAELVLTLNGEKTERQELAFTPGGDEGSYENLLGGIPFSLPEMEEDSQLDLTLEVTLSDGRDLSVTGGSWYYTGGELMLAVG